MLPLGLGSLAASGDQRRGEELPSCISRRLAELEPDRLVLIGHSAFETISRRFGAPAVRLIGRVVFEVKGKRWLAVFLITCKLSSVVRR
jgi:hypothetical protein